MAITRLGSPPPASDPGYLDGKVPSLLPQTATGVQLIAPETADTLGTWHQMIPAAGVTTDFVVMGLVGRPDAAQGSYLIELGVGAAGAEVVIARTKISNGNVDLGAGVTTACQFAKPVKVAANARVAVRVALSRATTGSRSILQSSLLYYPLA